jgi:predicted dehydrogenase
MSPARSKTARTIGVGIVGFGYMGRTHLASYGAAARAGFPNRIVALCDKELARVGGKAFQLGNRLGNMEKRGANPFAGRHGIAIHAEAAKLFADESIELVSLCTPTDTHVPLALAALAAGKHVLLEKPVALRARDVARLAAAAKKSRRLCMPAMCMRFWPGWTWLKEEIDGRTFGPVHSAVFRRLGSPPAWSRGFYGDPAKSGGALFDLHVHDADLVRHCFGAPASLVSTGSLDHVTTLYRFPSGPGHVVAEGGWNHAAGYPFFMGFTVVFERATAEYALGRTPLLTLARDGKNEPVELEALTGYDGEVRHALEVLAGRARPRATIAEAVELVRMLEAERKSLTRGRPVAL